MEGAILSPVPGLIHWAMMAFVYLMAGYVLYDGTVRKREVAEPFTLPVLQ